MRNKTVFDCFILMGTALSIRGGTHLPDMARPLPEEELFQTAIDISLVITEINILGEEMIMEIDGILSLKWIDPRLSADENTRNLAVIGKIWEPKITNINGENLMEKDEETVFWRGYGDEGNVILSKKIKLRVYCTTNFQNFPFDIQYCNFKFGSYRFPADEISLYWDQAPVEILSQPRTTDFILMNVTKDISIEVRPSGNFSVASLKLAVKRNFTRYILCTGAPCIIMVLLDYISLWMELDKRWNVNLVSCSVTSYFYFTSLCTIQPVAYFKAQDIFVGMCSLFSLISMLETFVVDSISKLGGRHDSFPTNDRIYWLELGMKITFPVFYLMFISFFGYIYII